MLYKKKTAMKKRSLSNYNRTTIFIWIFVSLTLIGVVGVGIFLLRRNDDGSAQSSFNVSISGSSTSMQSTRKLQPHKLVNVNDLTELGTTVHPPTFLANKTYFPYSNNKEWAYSDLYKNPSVPDQYVVKIHEIGFCDNIGELLGGGNTLRLQNKVVMFNSQDGQEVDIGGTGSKYNLNAAEVRRPQDGTYSYAYVIMSNEFSFKTNVTFNVAKDSDSDSNNDNIFDLTEISTPDLSSGIYDLIHEDYTGNKTYYSGTAVNGGTKKDWLDAYLTDLGSSTVKIINWTGFPYNPIADSTGQTSYAPAAEFPNTAGKTKRVRAYLAESNDITLGQTEYNLTGGTASLALETDSDSAQYIIGVVELDTSVLINASTIRNVDCNIDTASLRMFARATYTCESDSDGEGCAMIFGAQHDLGPFALSFTTTSA